MKTKYYPIEDTTDMVSDGSIKVEREMRENIGNVFAHFCLRERIVTVLFDKDGWIAEEQIVASDIGVGGGLF